MPLTIGYLDQKANDVQSFNFNPTHSTQLAFFPNIQIPKGNKIESKGCDEHDFRCPGDAGWQLALQAQFGPGDYFQLNIYGTNAQGQLLPNPVNFYLANFLNGSSSIVQSWTNVDLSALSSATTLYFNLQSSDNGPYGMNTPGYLAPRQIFLRRCRARTIDDRAGAGGLRRLGSGRSATRCTRGGVSFFNGSQTLDRFE